MLIAIFNQHETYIERSSFDVISSTVFSAFFLGLIAVSSVHSEHFINTLEIFVLLYCVATFAYFVL